ncbi:MAG: hypothetical protein LBJ25_07450, partial [Candidatus Margulisbacteria bacterium]|nr:hypothetical protein [Candidatus Margulisiibacteriota bacterium]
NLDRDREKWNEITKKRAEAGRLGGIRTQTNNQNQANQADNDIENESEINTPALAEIEKYFLDSRYRASAVKFFKHYQAMGWKKNGAPIEDWKALADLYLPRRVLRCASTVKTAFLLV